MSEKVTPDNGKEPPKLNDIVLAITLTPDGQVKVTGPINNEPLAFWLLEKSKDIIKGYNFQQSQPKIQKPGGMMNFARNRIFK